MISYKRGDVILVDMAFTGSQGYKRRPAVVISIEAFNNVGIKLIVAAITSNISPPFRPGDILLDSWSEAGLLKPSAVRGIVTTVDRVEVIRKLGKLSQRDRIRVDEALASILGFSISSASEPEEE